jgi:hypothetical protein
MTKKLPPLERPVTARNLVPSLQHIIAKRAKFIAQAEAKLAEQRSIIKQLRDAAKAAGSDFDDATKQQVAQVLGRIRLDIKALAYEQKFDRTMLRQMTDLQRQINYYGSMVDEVRLAVALPSMSFMGY